MLLLFLIGGYNTVLAMREQRDEIARLTAELEGSKMTVSALKEQQAKKTENTAARDRMVSLIRLAFCVISAMEITLIRFQPVVGTQRTSISVFSPSITPLVRLVRISWGILS